MSENEIENEEEPGFVKKIFLIPCMTKSFMYGISGGLGIGLGHFLLTSNVSRATNFGFGSYLVVLLGTWGVCRYQVAIAREKYTQVQKAMQNREGHTNLKHLDPKDV